MDAEELGMQQALLRKGSNRNTAAGGLKETISRRCACASQNIEEGGGGNTGNQLGREGRGLSSQLRERSARGPRHAVRAVDTDGLTDAAGRADKQTRNNPDQQECSRGAGEGADVVMTASDFATCAEMDRDQLKAHGYSPQNAQAATHGGTTGCPGEVCFEI